MLFLQLLSGFACGNPYSQNGAPTSASTRHETQVGQNQPSDLLLKPGISWPAITVAFRAFASHDATLARSPRNRAIVVEVPSGRSTGVQGS